MSRIAEIMDKSVDRVYRTTVLLQRSDRPKYWTFNCMNCRTPICELLGVEVIAMGDLLVVEDMLAVGVPCKNGYCRRVYYFELS